MSINKKNAEGYSDPTAYEALSAAARAEKAKARPYRPLVYICSPFAGNVERNTLNTRQYSRFAVERGAIPFAPHLLYPQFMDERDKEQRALGLFFGGVILCKCDELWAFGGHCSEGMRLEIAKARRKGIPVRFFTENCEEVSECIKP
jgi:hypothetical protein